MVQRGKFLLEARDLLNDRELAARHRLESATRLFWMAYMFQGSDWSGEDRGDAERLLDRLMAGGRAGNAIAQMDDAAVARLTEELHSLVDRCDKS
jgi:hypothetical protein